MLLSGETANANFIFFGLTRPDKHRPSSRTSWTLLPLVSYFHIKGFFVGVKNISDIADYVALIILETMTETPTKQNSLLKTLRWLYIVKQQ